jgi:hypothetical protein
MLAQIRTLYTVHNIEYQGKYDLSILEDVFALDRQFENIVKYNDEINLTKGAVTVSDFVSTVSPNYANELKHDFFAFGLSNVICDASHKMCGIINGIDYSYFSPDVGGDIYSPYTRRAFKTGKAKNKKALQAELNEARKASKAESDRQADFARAAKPYLDAQKLLNQKENYSHFDNISAQYDISKEKHEKALAKASADAEKKKREEDALNAKIKAEKEAKKKAKKAAKVTK